MGIERTFHLCIPDYLVHITQYGYCSTELTLVRSFFFFGYIMVKVSPTLRGIPKVRILHNLKIDFFHHVDRCLVKRLKWQFSLSLMLASEAVKIESRIKN